MLTGMKLYAVGIAHLVVMTVDALSVGLEAAQHVVVDHTLVVVLQTALTDGQGFVAHERRGDETIAQVTVDAVGRHMDLERLVMRPLLAVAHKHIHVDVATLSCQRLPVGHRRLHLVLANHLDAITLIAGNHAVGLLVVKFEGQRSYVLGNGHIDDIRIDLW